MHAMHQNQERIVTNVNLSKFRGITLVIANLGWAKLILFDYEGNLDRIKISNHETQKSIEACIDHLHGARRRQKESVSA